MGPYLGDFKPTDTIYHLWTTHLATGGGATRTANGTLALYENNSLAQLLAGITDTEDFDGVTGLHLATIDLATAGCIPQADYSLVLTGATVDGETGIIAVLCSFSVMNRGVDVVSRGGFDAVDATSFTLQTGKRADVRVGDSIFAYTPAGVRLGERFIKSYNATTGVGTVSDWDTTPTTSDLNEVRRLPRPEALVAADLDPSAVTAIQTGLATDAIEDTLEDNGAGVMRFTSDSLSQSPTPAGVALAADLAAAQADIDAIGTMVSGIDGRLPAALVGGKIDAVAEVDESAIAEAVFARAVESGLTFEAFCRLMGAVFLGKTTDISDTATTFTSADIVGGAVNGAKTRISATRASDSDRLTITVDLT